MKILWLGMRVVFYSNCITPHQLPLAKELCAKVGASNFIYVSRGRWNDSRAGGGWVPDLGMVKLVEENTPIADDWIRNAEVMVVGGLRPVELIEDRLRRGLFVFYQFERWFKPIPIVVFGKRLKLGRWRVLALPGWVRMLVPTYRAMAKRVVRLLNNCPRFMALPIGPHAKNDMLNIGVKPQKLIDWGYFVFTSDYCALSPVCENDRVRLLWVGRMLDWKRVDTVIRAVARVNERVGFCKVQLTLVGAGPELERLRNLAEKYVDQKADGDVVFVPPVPLNEVRILMRTHDAYVLPSNAEEGWGAALSEACSEGMVCFGTYEAGASAALLPKDRLYHAGDYFALSKMLYSFAVDWDPSNVACDKRARMLSFAYTPSWGADMICRTIKACDMP